MDFNLTEEQKMLQDSLRRFVDNEYSFDKRSKIIASGQGVDKTTWSALADMGLLGFTFPEEHEGLGGDAIDTMLVMECFGRGLVVEPYLATVVLAGGLIRDAGSEAQKAELLPAIAAGEKLMALAHHEPGARYNLSRVNTEAKKSGEGYTLNGRKTAVIHGAQADQLVVSARTSGQPGDTQGLSLFLVDGNAPGLTRHDFATHDGNRTADLVLENVSVTADALVGPADQAFDAIEKAFDLGIAAICAEAVGAMESLNKATLEYSQERKQFGVPIGKFQVLQHRMADMFMYAEQARTMAILAADQADSTDREERRRAVSSAKALIGQYARDLGQSAVQIHGGMGVTDEMFCSHLFKRLTLINLQFGNADHHLAQVSDQMLAQSA